MSTMQRVKFALPGGVVNAAVSVGVVWVVASLFTGRNMLGDGVTVPLTAVFASGVGVGVGAWVIAGAMTTTKKRFPLNAMCLNVFIVAVAAGIGFALV